MLASWDVAEILRRHKLRVTPQRRAILDAFRGTPEEHLSAEEVLSRASAEVPEIGRGTVYAALAELTELGVLASVGHAEPLRYETNIVPHDHFYCRLCMRMFDVDLGGAAARTRPLVGYQVETVAVRADGVCADCRNYHRGLSDGAQAIKDHPALDTTALNGLSCAVTESPVGELGLVASGEGVVRIAFADHADFDAISRVADGARGAESGRLQSLGRHLRGYLAGSHEPLTDAIDWELIGEPLAGPLRSVSEIPYGTASSYVEICSEVEPYACGRAMGANPLPLLIPCHRVACGTRRPEVYVGGSQRLHFLQRLEDAPS